MNIVRIWAIAANGFQETIRDRVLYLIGFFALLLAIALRLLPEIAATTENKIFLDLGLGAIGLLSPVVAIFVGTGLINKEIEKRTVLVLIPKPISRAEFIIGKHLGLAGVLAVLVTVMSLIYFGLLVWGQIDFPLVSILVSIVFLFLELILLVAAAMVFGVFTSSLLATLLAFGIYLMGHFSRDLVELGNLSENESIQFFTSALYLVLPDLSRLNLRNEAVYGLLPPVPDLLSDALYGLVYTVVLLAIAIGIFSRRQF
ncbi:ABC transporter permease [Oscillatoria salina]|uniref:ABC transporter permease n=1 Tax=Oscillatoria salina TaxID=331517 RepID=UPI001CC987B6|nr:ABC transporter permease [Oscillatoria salina]MBZ8182293.1 ABC transporter permease [Oscillatoria salina IIICB1]